MLSPATIRCAARIQTMNPIQFSIQLSRLLLLLVAVELLTMPLTQHFWAWDRFLHGGQDFELTLLVTVSCLCLVLLRAQHCRRAIGLLLVVCGLDQGSVVPCAARNLRRGSVLAPEALLPRAGGVFLWTLPLPLRI